MRNTKLIVTFAISVYILCNIILFVQFNCEMYILCGVADLLGIRSIYTL